MIILIMLSTKRTTRKIAPIKKVCVSATLMQIMPGETIYITRKELGPEGAVRSAMSRANKKANRREFEMEVVDYGTRYKIIRNE